MRRAPDRFSKLSGAVAGRGKARPDEDVIRLLERRAINDQQDAQREAEDVGTPRHPGRRGLSEPEAALPLPAPDARYLRATRELRAHFVNGDQQSVHSILTDLTRDPHRVFGPFHVPAEAPVRASIMSVQNRRYLVITDFPVEVDGCSAVLVAPEAIRHMPRGSAAELTGWIRAETVIRRGTTRFALPSSPPMPLGEHYVILDPAPSPADFTRIGLVATSTLRQGPASTFARMVRELTPYLMRYTPDLYVVEGAYRTILNCGLLREFPARRLHCLPPGRLGALVDMGAGVAGHPVAALHAALGEAEPRIAEHLDLGWGIDCVIYLIDPLAPTSTMPETLALERECAQKERPFLDTYASVIEWFGLLDSNERSGAVSFHQLSVELATELPEQTFPYSILALLAHDDKKHEMARFVLRHFRFLSRFDERIGSGGTAAMLNQVIATHATRLAPGRVSFPWVQELDPGPDGGNLQVGESLAMGLCDAALCFGDPRPSIEPGVNTHLFERTARIGNDRDRLSTQVMFLHDAASAAAWALMWTEINGSRPPTTLISAFAELFNVDLVLADATHADATRHARQAMIAADAAWFLASAVAANRTRTDRPDEPKRVTIACGAAMARVVAAIPNPVSIALNDRIGKERERHSESVRSAVEEFPQLRRRIERIATRKQLTLRTTVDMSALWSVGPLVVAPMIGGFGAATVPEANKNADTLAKTFGGEALALSSPAFERKGHVSSTTPELVRHWASTDVVLMTCADLAPALFGGAWNVPLDMYRDLSERAVGEVAGLYLDKDGNEVIPGGYERRGMPIDEIRAVAKSHDNRTAIMAIGATEESDHSFTRVSTALAALRAGIVSVLVTDVEFARQLVAEHLAGNHSGSPALQHTSIRDR